MKLSVVNFAHPKTLSYRVTVLFCCFWSVSYHVMTWLRLYWGLVSFFFLQKITGKYRNTVYLTGDMSTWQFWSFGEHLSNRPHFLWVYRCDSPCGMLGEHEKSLYKAFTSFSSVLPTSQVGYHTGKPIESVVYCFYKITLSRMESFR